MISPYCAVLCSWHCSSLCSLGQWQPTCWSLGCSAQCFSLKCCYWNHPLHKFVHLARPRSHSHGRSSWVQHSTTCTCPRQTCTHSWDSCSSDLAHQRRKYIRCRKQCRGGNERPCRYPLWSTCVHGNQQCSYLVRLCGPQRLTEQLNGDEGERQCYEHTQEDSNPSSGLEDTRRQSPFSGTDCHFSTTHSFG